MRRELACNATLLSVMAILKVARLGHPILREVARPVPVEHIRSAEIQRVIDDMVETMHEYDGAGLAAPQVHTLLQIAVIEVEGNPRYPDASSIPLTVVVNPVVTPMTEEMEDGWEGCLSVPDMRGMVPRYTAVRLQCHDRDGQRGRSGGQGLLRPRHPARDRPPAGDRVRRPHADLSTLSYMAEWKKHWLGLKEESD